MNIVQMHETVRFWLDTVRSPRQETEEIDRAINLVIDKLVEEKYEYLSMIHPRDSFQKTQKVRDELGRLVKRITVANGGAAVTVGIKETDIVLSEPDSFRHLLDLSVVISDDKYVCFPIDLNHKNMVDRSPFKRPRITKAPKIYYFEREGNFTIMHPANSVISEVDFYILRNPVPVKYGIEYDESGPGFGSGEKVIVAKKGTVYSAVSYSIGDVITIGSGILNIDSGLVVSNFVNCELNITLHEEIARRAAIEILRATGEERKVAMLMAELQVR